MSKYVNAEELKAQIRADKMLYYPNAERLCECIDNMPRADVAPVVHAHWEIVEPWCEGPVWFKCSNCEEPYIFEEDEKYKYCPNCGAKMDEGTE